jgi:cell division protein FtsL
MSINKRKKLKLLRAEKLLYTMAICLLLMSPVAILFSKATLSKLNIDVEELKEETNAQQKKNQSLTMKVNELSSLENIQMVAQNMGLKYNNNNIKTID